MIRGSPKECEKRQNAQDVKPVGEGVGEEEKRVRVGGGD